MKRNPTGVDAESFANPTLRIVQVTNAAGQVICYCPIQQAVILNPPVRNPQATSIEMFAAGSIIEGEIVKSQGKRNSAGASKLLMILPENTPSFPGEKWVRVVGKLKGPSPRQSLHMELVARPQQAQRST